MMDTQGMTAPRLVKTLPTSSSTTGIVHHKDARGWDKHAHQSREIII
jgi:hypothetical protein